MDASARSHHHHLKLRRPAPWDPVDSVVHTFLARDTGEVDAPRPVKPCRDDACQACTPHAEFKPLNVRCPEAGAVTIGVEPTGRICLEVQVGTGAGVKQVLGELERAERWLRSSAHDAAMTAHAGPFDMSRPVRRVIIGPGDLPVGTLRRAGIEVRPVLGDTPDVA